MTKDHNLANASTPRKMALLTAFLATVLTLLAAEIAVRVLFRHNSPRTVRENSVQYIPAVYARHLISPSQSVEVDKAWGLRDEAERTGRTFEINDQGYRGTSFAVPKPVGVCRVVILGGSAVFDQHSREGMDWPHLVAKNLAESGYPEVEVINAGVPGHASFDSLGRLYTQVWMFEPDYVLFYNAWNDVKTFRTLSRHSPLISLVQPLDLAKSPFHYPQGFLDRVLCHSQLYVKLRTRFLMWKLEIGPEGAMKDVQMESEYNPLAVEQYRLNVELIVHATRAIGATSVLLTQASLIADGNTEAEKERIVYPYQGLTHDALVSAMNDCNSAVREVASREDVALLDLAEMFSGESELFADHVHTTESGSAKLAAAVASFLRSELSNCRPSLENSTSE